MCGGAGSLHYHRSDLGPKYDLATLKQDYPISEAASKEQQAPVKAKFPFDRLPPELQLSIISFAMPEHGLRPLPLPGLDFPKDDIPLTEYADTLRRDQNSPQALFRASKWLSSEAVRIFYNEVKLRIDVDPAGLRFMDEAIGNQAAFHSHLVLKGFPIFRRQRNIELYIKMDGNDRLDFYTRPDGYCYNMKEWLRLITDALLINPRIDSLAVYLPCPCTLPESDCSGSDASVSESDASDADSDMLLQPDVIDPQTIDALDFLTPLKRLRVRKSTAFLPYRGGNHPRVGGPCLLPECHKMLEHVQCRAGMEQLSGEKLNEREKAWKRLKFDVTRRYYLTENEWFHQVWRCLDDRDDDIEFEEAVQGLQEYLPARVWD